MGAYQTSTALFEDTEPLVMYDPMGPTPTDRIEYFLWDARLRDNRRYYPWDKDFLRLDKLIPSQPMDFRNMGGGEG
jgi:hypothetical protein